MDKEVPTIGDLKKANSNARANPTDFLNFVNLQDFKKIERLFFCHMIYR